VSHDPPDICRLEASKRRNRKKSPPIYQVLCCDVGLNVHHLLVHHQLLVEGRVTLAKTLETRPGRKARCKCPACRASRQKRGRKRKADARNLWLDGWEPGDFAQVGDAPIHAIGMPCFVWDKSKRPYMPAIAPEWLERVNAIRQELAKLDDNQMPSFERIPPWTSPMRNGLPFVDRVGHRDALEQAFNEREKVYGADALEDALAVEAATPAHEAGAVAVVALAFHTSTAGLILPSIVRWRRVFGQEIRVAILGYRPFALWALGHPTHSQIPIGAQGCARNHPRGASCSSQFKVT
jgi:hypothetical protein